MMKTLTKAAVPLTALICMTVAHAAEIPAEPVVGQGTWEQTLKGRDINGNAVALNNARPVSCYDQTLNITWLRDWNYAKTSGFDSDGAMTWDAAVTWASTLNIGGFEDWRLPSVSPVNGSAFQEDFSNNGSTDSGYSKTDVGWGLASELGHMYYVTWGNKGGCTPNDASPDSCDVQSDWGLSNTARFDNVWSPAYWAGLGFALRQSNAWLFYTSDGGQDFDVKSDELYAVAVRTGDVATTVPEPQAVALMLAGFGTLVVVCRRRPS